MYNTPAGERVFRGAERRLFVESLGMMIDYLSTGDCDFEIAIFDNLQRNQKLAALRSIARALLCNDSPAPRLTAVVEGAVASVYQHAREMLFQEIEFPDDDLDDRGSCCMPTWRELALAAGRESELEELPTPESRDKEHWDFLMLCLEGKVLWDNDWEADDRLDVAPEESRRLKSELGIPDDYYIAIPPDPSDEQAEQLLAELRDLTAECR
jgi:hypothetical protein